MEKHRLERLEYEKKKEMDDLKREKEMEMDEIRREKEMNTLFSLTKNLVYKNIEAQMWKKIRTIIRTSPASQRRIVRIFFFCCSKLI